MIFLTFIKPFNAILSIDKKSFLENLYNKHNRKETL